jgi:hypothetical protein
MKGFIHTFDLGASRFTAVRHTPTGLCLAMLMAGAAIPALAQTTLESGSNATANSGSQSGAASQSNPTNINAPVNHQGNLSSTSDSQSGAISGSESASGSISDQAQGQDQSQGQSMGQSMGANNAQGQEQSANNAQGQEQSANNSQGQSANNAQGQDQSANNSQTQGQMANNQQGVSVSNTFNSTNRKNSYVYTNNAVPLAASSSFSSDYCGGTASGGASAAPLGISIGGAGPVFDKSCQSLRRAEKFGMAAANASNMGQPDLAGRLMSMMIWSICTADSSGTKADRSTAMACGSIGLLGTTGSVQPSPSAARDPAVQTPAGYPTPEAASRQPSVTAAADVERMRAARPR